MQSIEISELKNRLKENFGEIENFELCEYGIEVNGESYFYGHVQEKGYFIVNKSGAMVSKEEAISVFKKFVLSNGIVSRTMNDIQQYVKRPVDIFKNLYRRLQKFEDQLDRKILSLEEDIQSVQEMIDKASSGQKRLKEILDQLTLITNAKCQPGACLTKTDFDQMAKLSLEVDCILYQQGRSIKKAVTPMKNIRNFIKNELNIFERLFDLNLFTLDVILKQLTTDYIEIENRKSLQTFEQNPMGKALTVESGELDIKQLMQNSLDKFDYKFEHHFLPELLNKDYYIHSS
jgi:hypothetical protein